MLLKYLSMLLCIGLSTGALARPQKVDQAQVIKISTDYAKCLVKRHNTLAWKIILEQPDVATIAKRYEKIIDSNCLNKDMDGKAMRFPDNSYMYALADALFQSDVINKPVTDFGVVAALNHRSVKPLDEASLPKNAKKAQALRDQWTRLEAVNFLSQYGECVVRASPKLSHDMLATLANSPQEGAAFVALGPAMSDCLPPGKTIKFGRYTLRGTIAVNYVRLAAAANPELPPTKGRK